MGDITGDLNHKRGRILGIGNEDGMQVITAEVPQAEMFRYSSELRSMTGGRGSFEMEFARYDIVPSQHRAEDHRRGAEEQEGREGRVAVVGDGPVQSRTRNRTAEPGREST